MSNSGLDHIRVKIINQGDEARTIAAQERRLAKKLKRARERAVPMEHICDLEGRITSLRNHRRMPLRSDTRAANVAYAYLRNKAYRQVEQSAITSPDWDKAKAMVVRFSGYMNADMKAWKMMDFEQWAKTGVETPRYCAPPKPKKPYVRETAAA